MRIGLIFKFFSFNRIFGSKGSVIIFHWFSYKERRLVGCPSNQKALFQSRNFKIIKIARVSPEYSRIGRKNYLQIKMIM
jgi:hypothetical protein